MRLIDADAQEERAYEIYVHASPEFKTRMNTLKTLIDEAPTIDAEPVRHGRWEEYEIPHIICCSECDWGTGMDERSNYCPNCGAKMDLR